MKDENITKREKKTYTQIILDITANLFFLNSIK